MFSNLKYCLLFVFSLFSGQVFATPISGPSHDFLLKSKSKRMTPQAPRAGGGGGGGGGGLTRAEIEQRERERRANRKALEPSSRPRVATSSESKASRESSAKPAVAAIIADKPTAPKPISSSGLEKPRMAVSDNNNHSRSANGPMYHDKSQNPPMQASPSGPSSNSGANYFTTLVPTQPGMQRGIDASIHRGVKASDFPNQGVIPSNPPSSGAASPAAPKPAPASPGAAPNSSPKPSNNNGGSAPALVSQPASQEKQAMAPASNANSGSRRMPAVPVIPKAIAASTSKESSENQRADQKQKDEPISKTITTNQLDQTKENKTQAEKSIKNPVAQSKSWQTFFLENARSLNFAEQLKRLPIRLNGGQRLPFVTLNFPHERFERSIAEFQTKHASHEADSKHANEFVYSNEQHLQLQTRETINLISLHAQQLFPQQRHNAQLKAYGDATQKLCEAAHVLNNEGMFDQAEAAIFFADASIKAGKAIINDARHIPGSSDIALVYDENVHYMRLHRVYECLTDMSDIMKDDLFNAWQEFKHQPTTGKILNVAEKTITALGLAYCSGASPSMVKALVQSIAHVIKQEAKELGRHLVVRAPFAIAPMISNMQRIFDSNQRAWTPSIAPRVTPQTVRTAQNVVRPAMQGAARVWNGATPFAQRIASNPAATSVRFQPPAVIQESVMAQHASSMQSAVNAVASGVDAKIGKEFINATIEIFEKNAKHMFRNDEGHIADTPENRRLLIEIASDIKNFLCKDHHGNSWYAKQLQNGNQVWISMRDNFIRNAGINKVPKSVNPKTGLSRP